MAITMNQNHRIKYILSMIMFIAKIQSADTPKKENNYFSLTQRAHCLKSSIISVLILARSILQQPILQYYILKLNQISLYAPP